ncbi:MAG TPA: RDD family protein [Casimicrobiaceae bacterium]
MSRPERGPAEPAPPTTAGPRRASLGPRFGALLYEALLLAAMALVAGFLFLPLVSPIGVGQRSLTVPPLFARTVLFCALVAGAAVYYTWCWSEGRRTLPQKTWRLRVVDADGRMLTRKTALVRYAMAWAGPVAAIAAYGALRPIGFGRYAAILLALNYAWALVDRDRQFLHDRIAGTRIVRGP